MYYAIVISIIVTAWVVAGWFLIRKQLKLWLPIILDKRNQISLFKVLAAVWIAASISIICWPWRMLWKAFDAFNKLMEG